MTKPMRFAVEAGESLYAEDKDKRQNTALIQQAAEPLLAVVEQVQKVQHTRVGTLERVGAMIDLFHALPAALKAMEEADA